jgi:hypothetical protein
VAVSTRHPLAGRHTVDFSEIIDEPYAALPTSAGPLRDFWLAADQRAGKPACVAAEAASADPDKPPSASGRILTRPCRGAT